MAEIPEWLEAVGDAGIPLPDPQWTLDQVSRFTNDHIRRIGQILHLELQDIPDTMDRNSFPRCQAERRIVNCEHNQNDWSAACAVYRDQFETVSLMTNVSGLPNENSPSPPSILQSSSPQHDPSPPPPDILQIPLIPNAPQPVSENETTPPLTTHQSRRVRFGSDIDGRNVLNPDGESTPELTDR